jgi:uncharacterized pyridoxamine 5'-phosphate oxidase family protein
MEIQEVLDWLKLHKICYLATVEGGGPRVRCMTLDRAEASGLYFHMPIHKAVYQQLKQNPQVEVCFVDLAEGIQMRVLGAMERDLTLESQEHFLKLHPHLAPSLALNGFESMALMRLSKGIVEIQKEGVKIQIQL